MKHFVFILILVYNFAFSQETITLQLKAKDSLVKSNLIAVDNYKALYYVNYNTLQKITSSKTLNYANVQLGNITSVNVFNPLKINVFYKPFNTLVILDNRLSEIYKIDFNTLETYRYVSYITSANDNTIWLFNENTQQLELYNYKTNETLTKTVPISDKVIGLTSNYNYCWLLTESYLYKFNYLGSLIYKLKNDNYSTLSVLNNSIIVQQEQQLLHYNLITQNFDVFNLPNLLINRFFVTNETLYIYSSNFLYQFQLKPKN